MAEPGTLSLADPAAMERLGASLADALRTAAPASLSIHLQGDLGTGKTTLVRALLRGLGHAGRVPSPTYTLIEPYRLAGLEIRHADLYRLQNPIEAAHLGLEEVPGPRAVWLIEWPEHGGPHVPPADVRIALRFEGDGRAATLAAASGAGRRLLSLLKWPARSA